MLLPLVFSVAAASTALADQTLYNYYVDSFPHTDATCQAAVADLSQAFTAATGVKVFSSACDDHQSSYFMTLSYAAAAELPLESTYDSINTSLAQGGYLAAADCEADKAAQIKLYTQATGLTPIVAYCFEEDFDSGSNFPFKLRIDGLGTAPQHYFDNVEVLGTADEGSDGHGIPSQSAAEAIGKNLAGTGAQLSRALVRTDNFGIVSLSLQYYAPTRLKLDYWEEGAFDQLSDCNAAIDPTNKALATLNAPALGVFCGLDGDFAKLSVVRVSDPTIVMERITQNYATLAACQADLANVLTNATTQLGWTVGGGICAGLDGTYNVFVYHKVAAPPPP